MLSDQNVKFYMNDNVTEVRGVDGKVKQMLIFSRKFVAMLWEKCKHSDVPVSWPFHP